MAQIDSRIALGFQPQTQLENPVNQLAKILQVQNMQMQNEAGRYDMELKRSDREQNNKLMQFLASNPDLNTPEGRRGLYEAAPLKADGILKSRMDTQKAGTDAEAATFKLANDRYTAYKKTLGALSADPMLTKEKVIQAGQELVSAGILPAAMLQNAIGNLPDDPEAIRASLRQGLASQLTPEQVFTVFSPKPEKIDNGQQIITRDMNPNSPTYGQNTGGAPVQKLQSPDSVASTSVAIRGQNLVDQRSRERLDFERGNAVADAGGPNQAGLTKRFGKAPPGYRWKEDGSAEAIPGGPADIKAGEAGAKAQGRKDAAALSANSVLGAVSEAKTLVGIDTTGPGSVLARVPGTDARNLQAKLDTIKANLGFDRLQQMREMSPTGGALGAVAVQELIALQSTVASLDQAQSPTELKNSLDKIERHYNKWLETVGGTTATESNSGPPKPGTVKNGYRFKGGDPANQNNWEKL